MSKPKVSGRSYGKLMRHVGDPHRELSPPEIDVLRA